MRQANVKSNGILAGRLTETDSGEYVFTYDADYLRGPGAPVSLTMPKRTEPYRSPYLFPVFFSMLSEGANKRAQCRLLKIDERDHFGLLLATAYFDTAGCLTIHKIP